MVLELPAPGVQDPGETREISPDEALVCGQPLESRCRRLQHGVVREALMRAQQRAEGLRHGEGEEAVRPGQLLVQVVLEPLLGCLLRTLGTGPVAAGMMDAVVLATTVALREAVAVVAAVALWDGADDLAVRGGEGGRALQRRWRQGVEEVAEGGHGRSPGMRECRRPSASACPLGVRCQEIMVVARGVGPRERCMRRGFTPAARRGVAYAGLRVGMATPIVVMPARCVAVRKAPWTLVRRLGEVAGGRWG